MDPYEILGVSQSATFDEIKMAFRREASKWHPDKAGSNPEAKQIFQDLNSAYQQLSTQLRNRSKNTQAKNSDSKIDDVVLDTMFDYAVSLARTGLTKQEVEIDIERLGYDSSLSTRLSQQAFEYIKKVSSGAVIDPREKYRSFFRTGIIDSKLTQAFLGAGYNYTGTQKERQTINYYQDVFGDLFQMENEGSVLPLHKNRYLFKLLFRSLALCALITSIISFFPFLTSFSPADDLDLFQLPNIVLSLMLVWAAYKKLGMLFVVGLFIFITTQIYFYYSMPVALEQGAYEVIFVSIISYLPFLFLVYFSNYFFYKKGMKVIELVCLDYHDDTDRHLLIKKKGGSSGLLAYVTLFFLALYFLHMVPINGSLQAKANWLLFNNEPKADSLELKQVKKRISKSKHFFEIAEKQYNSQPPDFKHAAIAYADSVKSGSLLSAYKLGYMYLKGKGVPQNNAKAFEYFKKATQSSLSSQPHNLVLTTKWLSESFKLRLCR